jgi:hypothetical protein
MESEEGALPHSQEPCTGLFPEPGQIRILHQDSAPAHDVFASLQVPG